MKLVVKNGEYYQLQEKRRQISEEKIFSKRVFLVPKEPKVAYKTTFVMM